MKQTIKKILSKIPGALPLAKALYRPSNVSRSISKNKHAKHLKNKNAEEVFTDIFRNRLWERGVETKSGAGSDLEQTEAIRIALPELVKELQIKTLLDVPCGDYWWMKEVELGDVNYIGGDIVADLIEENMKYANDKVTFRQLDLIKDEIPAVDLLFVRDCLVHLCYDDLFAALKNIASSEAKYLLTTTFTNRDENRDILTGQWRALNLEIEPFSFPPPEQLINEQHPAEQFADKNMGLWKIADLRQSIDAI